MVKLQFLVRSLLAWYRQNARDLPWRRTEDPYAIWISEVMLQQTQVKTVIPYWERWMRRFPTACSLARAKGSEVLRCWAGLGYYTRARNLHQAARLIVSRHEGDFPRKFDEIIALPGIGRYTAGAIYSIAFNQPAPVLDGNVTRVLTRIFGIATNPAESRTKRRLWSLAHGLVRCAANHQAPKQRSCADLNQALMELGATICTPRQPQCQSCPCWQFCRALRNNQVAQIPRQAAQPKSLPRRFLAFAVHHRGRFLVRQRPPGRINADLWEFPNVETTNRQPEIPRHRARQCLGFQPREIQALCAINHTITRYRIRLEAFTASKPAALTRKVRRTRWCTLKQLDRLAFPSAHRKIAEALIAKVRFQKPR